LKWAFCPLFLFPAVSFVSKDFRVAAVWPLADRVVRSHGLVLFDLQLRRESVGWVLRAVIDRPVRRDGSGEIVAETPEDGIGIAECQVVSTDLGTLLDVEDVLDVPYTLEVSSPGMDRPLREQDDYRRFVGRLVKLVVTEALEGQVHFEGHLRGVDGDVVLLQVGRQKMVRIPFARIARARLEVELLPAKGRTRR
jgi:ribosome maturation factor RimP